MPLAYVDWRGSTTYRVAVPVRQAGNRFLGSGSTNTGSVYKFSRFSSFLLFSLFFAIFRSYASHSHQSSLLICKILDMGPFSKLAVQSFLFQNQNFLFNWFRFSAFEHSQLSDRYSFQFPSYQAFQLSAQHIDQRHTKRQATQHRCLPSLLSDWDKGTEMCTVRKKIFCTGPTRAAKAE